MNATIKKSRSNSKVRQSYDWKHAWSYAREGAGATEKVAERYADHYMTLIVNDGWRPNHSDHFWPFIEGVSDWRE